MIIREASLCLRFYTSDGWTRSKVADLMKIPNIHAVIPRYFDAREDNARTIGHLLRNNWQYPNCDYYAVYHDNNPFCKEKITQHELTPFKL